MLKAARPRVPRCPTDMPGAQVIDRLRRYLGKALAETTQCHELCMDVLGLGVLITVTREPGKASSRLN